MSTAHAGTGLGRGRPDAAPALPRGTPVTAPREAPSRAPLRVVPLPGGRRPARMPFVVLVAGVLTVGLLGLLLLNTALAQGAFEVSDLERRSAVLADREQALQQQVAFEASPQRVAQRAASLGMVPSENPAFIRAADGAVLGVPEPGKPRPAPPPPAVPQPAAAPAAAPSAAPSTSPSGSPSPDPASPSPAAPSERTR